jgi:hypothetical protein
MTTESEHSSVSVQLLVTGGYDNATRTEPQDERQEGTQGEEERGQPEQDQAGATREEAGMNCPRCSGPLQFNGGYTIDTLPPIDVQYAECKQCREKYVYSNGKLVRQQD